MGVWTRLVLFSALLHAPSIFIARRRTGVLFPAHVPNKPLEQAVRKANYCIYNERIPAVVFMLGTQAYQLRRRPDPTKYHTPQVDRDTLVLEPTTASIKQPAKSHQKFSSTVRIDVPAHSAMHSAAPVVSMPSGVPIIKQQERAEWHDPEKEQARRGCIQEALHDAMGFKERGAHMYLRGCNFEPVLDIERWVEATGCGTMPLVGPL